MPWRLFLDMDGLQAVPKPEVVMDEEIQYGDLKWRLRFQKYVFLNNASKTYLFEFYRHF